MLSKKKILAMQIQHVAGASVLHSSAYHWLMPVLVRENLMGGTVQVTVQLTHLVKRVSFLATQLTMVVPGVCMIKDAMISHPQEEHAPLQSHWIIRVGGGKVASYSPI